MRPASLQAYRILGHSAGTASLRHQINLRAGPPGNFAPDLLQLGQALSPGVLFRFVPTQMKARSCATPPAFAMRYESRKRRRRRPDPKPWPFASLFLPRLPDLEDD